MICATTLADGWSRRGHRPARFVLPIVVAWIQVVGTYFASRHEAAPREYDVWAALLLGGSAAALYWRRKHQVPVLFATVALTALYWNLGYGEGPIFIAELFAFINAVVCGHRTAAIFAVVLGYPAVVWLPSLLDVRSTPSLAEALGGAAWVVAAFAGAEFFRSRRAAAVEAGQRRAEQRRRRASEERMEIARELHDVLAHNISLINVQANVGLHLMDEKPDQARSALGAIKEVSAETLGELRSVLDILRAGGTEAPRSPTSGLAHLDDLLDRTRTAGLDVKKEVRGTERAVPPEVDLAAFRIVQEALTNVRRHSGSSTATVTLTYEQDALEVRVQDAGRGGSVPDDTEGKGIEGMRERARALNGTLNASALPGGGFRVNAHLPFDGEATP